MYYEEKIVDGVWCWRNGPKGEWIPCNNSMVVNLVRERDELRAKLERVEEIAKTDYPDYEMQLSDIIKECE